MIFFDPESSAVHLSQCWTFPRLIRFASPDVGIAGVVEEASMEATEVRGDIASETAGTFPGTSVDVVEPL